MQTIALINKILSHYNTIIREWTNYFDQGPVLETYAIEKYKERRLQRLLAKKHKLKGNGYQQFSEEYLYGLGHFKLPREQG